VYTDIKNVYVNMDASYLSYDSFYCVRKEIKIILNPVRRKMFTYKSPIPYCCFANNNLQRLFCVCVLVIVHLSIILVINQLNAQILVL